MPTLPAAISLTSKLVGDLITAADHNNDDTAVQTAVNALIAILANGNAVDGDAFVWDNVNAKWAAASTLAATRPRAPRVVTSTMAGGPPGSPVDMDIWVATAVDANGTRWMFQYNAGSGSAFKWEFIGGPAVSASISTDEASVTAAAWTDLTTVGPLVTVARQGDYVVQGAAGMYSTGAAATVQLGIVSGAGTPLIVGAASTTAASLIGQVAVAPQVLSAVAAAADIRLRYQVSVANAHALNRTVSIYPRRVI